MTGLEVRAIRLKLGLSKKEFAKEIGVALRTIYNIEQGKKIKPENETAIMDLLPIGYTVEELVDDIRELDNITGETLPYIRRELSMTQKEMEDKIGTFRQGISYMERGAQKTLGESVMYKLVRLLPEGITVKEIVKKYKDEEE